MTKQRKYLHDLFHTSFLGTATIQYWADLFLWELFFKKHSLGIKQFVEFGTGYGGFSNYLLLQCRQRNIQFDTFDLNPPVNTWRNIPKLLGLEDCFHQGDIFEDQKNIVIELVSKSKVMLFCDNGNKRREFKEFAPYLMPESFVVVHDWGSEFMQEDIIYDNIETILVEECEDLDSKTRFFYVK